MSNQKFRLRACLWYEFKQGKSAAEAHRALFQVFDEDALSESQCKRWFQRFRDGDESLEDQKHGSRPQIIDNDALKEAIESDPRQTTRDLAEQFGCTHVTIENHLHGMGKTNRYGKWVPHKLSDANKATRIAIAGILTHRAKNSGFFDSIVTSNEKWIQYDNTARKRQWLDSGEAPKPDIHGKKVMLCVWWNSKGLVYFEVLDSVQTVTVNLYQG